MAMHSMMQGAECLTDVIFVHPVLHGLFTFLQMHFLFVNSQASISLTLITLNSIPYMVRQCVNAFIRFALMHRPLYITLRSYADSCRMCGRYPLRRDFCLENHFSFFLFCETITRKDLSAISCANFFYECHYGLC